MTSRGFCTTSALSNEILFDASSATRVVATCQPQTMLPRGDPSCRKYKYFPFILYFCQPYFECLLFVDVYKKRTFKNQEACHKYKLIQGHKTRDHYRKEQLFSSIAQFYLKRPFTSSRATITCQCASMPQNINLFYLFYVPPGVSAIGPPGKKEKFSNQRYHKSITSYRIRIRK